LHELQKLVDDMLFEVYFYPIYAKSSGIPAVRCPICEHPLPEGLLEVTICFCL